MSPVRKFDMSLSGVSENLITTTADALRKRELIKLRVLDNSMLTAREACEQLAEALGAEAVQAIGTKFVLYRRKPE